MALNTRENNGNGPKMDLRMATLLNNKSVFSNSDRQNVDRKLMPNLSP